MLIFCPLVLIIVLEVLQTITDIRLEKNEIQEIKKEQESENKKVVEEKTEVVVDTSVEKKNDDIEML